MMRNLPGLYLEHELGAAKESKGRVGRAVWRGLMP